MFSIGRNEGVLIQKKPKRMLGMLRKFYMLTWAVISIFNTAHIFYSLIYFTIKIFSNRICLYHMILIF